jgi:hypothetical protein
MLILLMRGFMNYAIYMGSGAMLYIPTFVKICSGIQKLLRGIHSYTDTKTAG